MRATGVATPVAFDWPVRFPTFFTRFSMANFQRFCPLPRPILGNFIVFFTATNLVAIEIG